MGPSKYEIYGTDDCTFCNKDHKYNRLGINKSKCILKYSCYEKHGYNLILDVEFDNFN